MTRACSFDGCKQSQKALGLCVGHYTQYRRGQELRPLRSQVTPAQKFWAKVDRSTSDGCWLWIGATNGNGYGKIRVDGHGRYAHRVAWEMVNSPIPEGSLVDHRCHNKRCVNPKHLRVVTVSENQQHLTGARKNSASGVRGVRFDKRRNSWEAYAKLNGRKYWGGYHPTIEAADAAARALRAELFTHDDHEQWQKSHKENVA